MNDIATAGWVVDPDDAVCWENGMKWLSKAIVSDNDPFDKQELKGQLDRHIAVALGAAAPAIRQTGIFYCLAWKKLGLLAGGVTGDYLAELRGGLARLYDNHVFVHVSFDVLVKGGRDEALAAVAALIAKKIPPVLFAELEEQLAASDDSVVGRALHVIEELVRVLNIPTEEISGLLREFWRKRQIEVGNYLAVGDQRRCRHYFALVEPARELLLAVGADHDRLLEDFAAMATGEDVFAGLRWIMRWRCRAALPVVVGKLWPGGRTVLVRVLRAHVDDPRLDRETCGELFDLAGRGGAPAVVELLTLFIDGNAPAPVFGGVLRDGLLDPQERERVFFLLGLMIECGSLMSTDIVAVRAGFLGRLWDSVQGSADAVLWADVLALLERLVAASGDVLLDGEFFQPLLRESLVSPLSAVSGVAAAVVARRPDLGRIVNDWLCSLQLQNELLEGLISVEIRTQIAALNRLVAIYCRYPVRSQYLSKRLGEYRDRVKTARLDEELRRKMLRAIDGILRRTEAVRPEG